MLLHYLEFAAIAYPDHPICTQARTTEFLTWIATIEPLIQESYHFQRLPRQVELDVLWISWELFVAAKS